MIKKKRNTLLETEEAIVINSKTISKSKKFDRPTTAKLLKFGKPAKSK